MVKSTERINLLKRSQVSVENKLQVIKWHHENGGNQSKTAAHFRRKPGFAELNQGTVCRWLKSEAKLQSLMQDGKCNLIREKDVKHPEFEKRMALWIDEMEQQNVQLSGRRIREAASNFFVQLGIPESNRLDLSNGWLTNFKKRQKLKLHRLPAEEYSSKLALVQNEQERVASIIQNFLISDGSRALDDVWNMDETLLFYASSPEKRSPLNMRKEDTARMTVALAVNATGTERLDPLFIGKHHSPPCFSGKTSGELGFAYAYSSRAGMTAEIFKGWLHSWNAQLEEKNRHILLFVDSVSNHLVDAELYGNIHLQFFEPKLTAFTQPCTRGIIRAFKAAFRRKAVLGAVDKLLSGDVDSDALFKIDQLVAMREAKKAWGELKAEVVSDCWKNAKILPGHTQLVDNGRPFDLKSIPTDAGEMEELHWAFVTLSIVAEKKQIRLPDLMTAKEFVDVDRTLEKALQSDTSELETEGGETAFTPVPAMNVYSSLLNLEKYWEESFRDVDLTNITGSQLLQLSRTQLQLEISTTLD